MIITWLFSIWITVICCSDSKYICECAHSVRKEYVAREIKAMPELFFIFYFIVKNNKTIIHAVVEKIISNLIVTCISKKVTFHQAK